MRRPRLVLALALALAAPATPAATWEAHPGGGRVVVHVFKTGLFSAFAHDHEFEVTGWRAAVELPDGDPAAASVEVVLAAGSLHDRQPRLSEGDRRKVDAQAAGPGVLDAEHHPEIVFRSTRVELEPAAADPPGRLRGKLHGTLTLRGRSAPATVAFEAERSPDAWRVHGTVRLKQTDLGIEPFNGFGGTVGVKDEVEIELALLLRPAGR